MKRKRFCFQRTIFVKKSNPAKALRARGAFVLNQQTFIMIAPREIPKDHRNGQHECRWPKKYRRNKTYGADRGANIARQEKTMAVQIKSFLRFEQIKSNDADGDKNERQRDDNGFKHNHSPKEKIASRDQK
jgi:hypothetical protein